MFVVFGVGRWGEEEMKCDDARRDKSRLFKVGWCLENGYFCEIDTGFAK